MGTHRLPVLGVICGLLIGASAGTWAGDLKAELIEKVPFYKTVTEDYAPLYPAFARQMVQDYGITNGVCVDVGSSVGMFSMELAKITQMKCYALDIDPAAVRLCGILADEAGLTGRVMPIEGDAQAMPFSDASADLVFSRGSIPFWQDREAGVRECYRILKPGGVAYIGGGFSRVLDPTVRDPIARRRSEQMRKDPEPGFQPLSDLAQVARGAGIPESQFRFIQEPIAGWWLEIRKPADYTGWYQRWHGQMRPWHAQMAEQIVKRAGARTGRCLELGWGAGGLAVPMAAITDMDFIVGAYDGDAATVANAQARAAGCADRVQAVAMDPERLLFRDNRFDLVVGHAGAALWHNPARVYAEVNRVLKPGGIAILGTGMPPECGKEHEKTFRPLAKSLREATDAPPDGFKRCPEPETVGAWLDEAKVKWSFWVTGDIHCVWIVIHK